MKCDYKGCQKIATIYLKSVNSHYCREHFKEIMRDFLSFETYQKILKKKKGGKK
jgi:hypothetical protein